MKFIRTCHQLIWNEEDATTEKRKMGITSWFQRWKWNDSRKDKLSLLHRNADVNKEWIETSITLTVPLSHSKRNPWLKQDSPRDSWTEEQVFICGVKVFRPYFSCFIPSQESTESHTFRGTDSKEQESTQENFASLFPPALLSSLSLKFYKSRVCVCSLCFEYISSTHDMEWNWFAIILIQKRMIHSAVKNQL